LEPPGPAFASLAFKAPELLGYFEPEEEIDSLDDIVVALNGMICRADAAIGCPMKAVSYHGEIQEVSTSFLEWEMMIKPATFVLPKTGGMRVPGLVIATQGLLEEADLEQPLEQVRNVAYLPGIVGYSIAMPDIHWGYGFPIGGVAAMDAETGVISPGGVGYDINCGVRLAIAPLLFKEMDERMKRGLLDRIFQLVPKTRCCAAAPSSALSDRATILLKSAKSPKFSFLK
jgi:hypothetical protein